MFELGKDKSVMSDEQQRYLQLLEDWKSCRTKATFKEYVLACGYTEKQYNDMMSKRK